MTKYEIFKIVFKTVFIIVLIFWGFLMTASVSKLRTHVEVLKYVQPGMTLKHAEFFLGKPQKIYGPGQEHEIPFLEDISNRKINHKVYQFPVGLGYQNKVFLFVNEQDIVEYVYWYDTDLRTLRRDKEIKEFFKKLDEKYYGKTK